MSEHSLRSPDDATQATSIWPEVTGPGLPDDLPPLDRYLSDDELRAAHPEPPWAIYHSLEHTLLVRLMAFEMAKGFGLPDDQVRFLSEVALLHDWDPERPVGTPARVPATLRILGLDFVGKRPLNSRPGSREAGPSLLRERFGWGPEELQMAFAMIYRTEFPFDGAHPNDYYAHASPAQRYTRALVSLPARSRAFVLEQAPVLSQFADQTAWYATQPFEKALVAVEGLVNELNAAQGPQMSTQELNTTGFLYAIGEERSFDADYRIARAFGIEGFVLPNHDEAFALVPPWYGRTFRANKAAFDAYDRALAGGQSEHEAAALGLRIFEEQMSEDQRV